MPYPIRSLEGTVVAITGASAGIGTATAYDLVDAGARVAVSARREDRLAKIVADPGEDQGVTVAYGGILDLDDATLTEMVETNYLGTVWSVRSAVKQFRAQGDGGDVVIVASV